MIWVGMWLMIAYGSLVNAVIDPSLDAWVLVGDSVFIALLLWKDAAIS